jgi:hypothetical protein
MGLSMSMKKSVSGFGIIILVARLIEMTRER